MSDGDEMDIDDDSADSASLNGEEGKEAQDQEDAEAFAGAFESLWQEQDDLIEFVPTVGEETELVEKLVSVEAFGLKDQMVTDVDQIRVSIPGPTGVKIKASMVWKMLKDLVGKDLSKFAMPVFINEPTSVVQKSAEFMFFGSYATQASYQPTSSLRMLYLACNQIACYYLVPQRLGKPFNCMLGETYELVTPQFRYFAEMVTHHPPICCMSCDGENFSMFRVMETV